MLPALLPCQEAMTANAALRTAPGTAAETAAPTPTGCRDSTLSCTSEDSDNKLDAAEPEIVAAVTGAGAALALPETPTPSQSASTTFSELPSSLSLLMVFLVCSNLLFYADRGVVPGASAEVTALVVRSLHTTQPSVYLGLMQSVFVLFPSLFSPLFSLLHDKYPAFVLLLYALGLWVAASATAAAAGRSGVYVLLLLARGAAGAAQAAFLTIGFPLLAEAAVPEERGRLLVVYLASAPVGFAAGTAAAATAAATPLCWYFTFAAFALGGAALLPVCLVLHHKHQQEHLLLLRQQLLHRQQRQEQESPRTLGILPLQHSAGAANSPQQEQEQQTGSLMRSNNSSGSSSGLRFTEQLRSLLSSVPFVCLCCGYSVYSAVQEAAGTFLPSISMGLSLFSSELQAASTIGTIIAVAGSCGPFAQSSTP